MKYLSTVDLTEGANVAALHDGLITLQPGQWVRFNKDGKPSRFLGASRHTIYALHDNTASAKHIQTLRQAFIRNHSLN